MLASRMVKAERAVLPVEIFLIKRGTSMWVGQAAGAAHGGVEQNRQRLASAQAAAAI